MMTEMVDEATVLRLAREALGLPGTRPGVDPVLLAGLVRRAAAIHCPCSPATLTRAILESLKGLTDDAEGLAVSVEIAVEEATVAGDLLELGQVTTDDPNVKGTWVFAGPPAFVIRPGRPLLLMGVVPERPHPLPDALASRIIFRRHVRLLESAPGEGLPLALRDLGLLEMSEEAWLRLPRPETAAALQSRLEAKLRALPASGDISDIELIDPMLPNRYYRGRWIKPKRETGTFVARRPRAYGAPLWGYALLEQGRVAKFLDFPLGRDRWRGCDAAWHLQMAIDAQRGFPQRYRRRPARGGAAILDFFGPLPLWAQRRLCLIGEPAEPEHALVAFEVTAEDLPAEEEFLQSRLWLARDEQP
ncbi:MAG: hypothetical protein AB7G07_09080 [Bauldia sp.]